MEEVEEVTGSDRKGWGKRKRKGEWRRRGWKGEGRKMRCGKKKESEGDREGSEEVTRREGMGKKEVRSAWEGRRGGEREADEGSGVRVGGGEGEPDGVGDQGRRKHGQRGAKREGTPPECMGEQSHGKGGAKS